MDRQLDILRCCVGVDRSMQNAFGKAHGSLEQLQIFEVLVAISYVLQANAFYRYTSRAADAVNGARVQHISIAVATINWPSVTADGYNSCSIRVSTSLYIDIARARSVDMPI